MTAIRDVLLEMGATITSIDEHRDLVAHCGRPMTIEAMAGGILGPDTVRCDVCGAAVDRGPGSGDDYVIRDRRCPVSP